VVAAVVRLRKGNRRISPQRAQRSTEEAEKDKKEQKRKKDLTAETQRTQRKRREKKEFTTEDAEVGAQRSQRVGRKLCTGPALLDLVSVRFQF
jgi:Sec-independent protein translocase protein TatA